MTDMRMRRFPGSPTGPSATSCGRRRRDSSRPRRRGLPRARAALVVERARPAGRRRRLGADRAGRRAGRARRHLVDERPGVGRHAVRGRPDRRGARQHQPGRIGSTSWKTRCKLADVATLIVGLAVQGRRTSWRWSRRSAPRWPQATSLDWSVGPAAPAPPAGRDRPPARPRLARLVRPRNRARSHAEPWPRASGLSSPTTSTTSSSPRARPACPRGRCSRTATC